MKNKFEDPCIDPYDLSPPPEKRSISRWWNAFDVRLKSRSHITSEYFYCDGDIDNVEIVVDAKPSSKSDLRSSASMYEVWRTRDKGTRRRR